jgi:hypothetical protein
MRYFTIALLSLVAMNFAQAAVTITPQSTGLQVTGDSEYLKFTITYPVLSSSDKKKSYSNKGVEVKDNTATVKYEGGGELDITVDASSGTISIRGQNLPSDVATVELRMQVNSTFRDGGSYQFGSKPSQPFPETKPDKPHLFQGNVDTFIIRAGDGKGIQITVPKYAYQEITDMREWGTNAYGWMSLANFNPSDELIYKIEDAPVAPVASGDGSSTNAAPAMQ